MTRPKAKPKPKPKAKDPKLVDRLYNTGMQLADCLRLLGEHDAAHDTEAWVLTLVRQMKGESV